MSPVQELLWSAARNVWYAGDIEVRPPSNRLYWKHPYRSAIPGTGTNEGISPFNEPMHDGLVELPRTHAQTINLNAPNATINYQDQWSMAVWYEPTEGTEYEIRNAAGTVVYCKVRIPTNWFIPLPAPGVERDSWVSIIRADGRGSIDCYKTLAVRSATGVLLYFTVSRPPMYSPFGGNGVHLNTTGITGDVNPIATQGPRAAATGWQAGLNRLWELLDADDFLHAAAIAIPNSSLKDGWVYPARNQDANGGPSSNPPVTPGAYTGQNPMGTRAGLPRNQVMTKAALGISSDEGMKLARQLQRYGAYVVDRSGGTTLTVERVPNDYARRTEALAAYSRMTADWRILWKLCVPYLGTSATAPGGTGNRMFDYVTPEGSYAPHGM